MTEILEIVATSSVPEEVKEDEKTIKIRSSIFFDGTLNNSTNINHRLVASLEGNDKKPPDDKLSDEEVMIAQELIKEMTDEGIQRSKYLYSEFKNEDSYENGYTNIVKLEKYFDTEPKDGYKYVLSSYIEGPGSVNDEKDDTLGYAFGVWTAGVKEKVKKGISDVVHNISANHLNKNVMIDTITLDAFGFSRGAAAARYYIHQALLASNSVAQQLKDLNYNVGRVEVCFAGLYDTVSSHGLSFNDDTKKLKLDAITHAKEVVQLAAADEHRKKFSLTNIKSAKSGIQIFLPGVHSDVGGSYRDGKSESLTIYWATGFSAEEKAKAEKDNLIKAGWYKDDELTIKINMRTRAGGKVRIKVATMHAKRESISNQYSRIPLSVMAAFARDNKIVMDAKLEDNEKVPDALNEANKKVKKYVNENKGKGEFRSKADDWINNNQRWLLELRHGYFHFSAKYSLGLTPRYENGKRKRKEIYG